MESAEDAAGRARAALAKARGLEATDQAEEHERAEPDRCTCGHPLRDHEVSPLQPCTKCACDNFEPAEVQP